MNVLDDQHHQCLIWVSFPKNLTSRRMSYNWRTQSSWRLSGFWSCPLNNAINLLNLLGKGWYWVAELVENVSKTVDTARQVVLINELSLEASQKGKTSLSILTNPLFFNLAPVEVVINIHPYTAFVVHIANTSKNRQFWLALTWHRNTSGVKCNITAE